MSKIDFPVNARAIFGKGNDIKISECNFKNNMNYRMFSVDGGKIFVEKSSFKGFLNLDCSVLYADNIDNITLSDLTIMNNKMYRN